MITISVRPHHNGLLYVASLDGRVLCTHRTPFLAAARVLLKEGVPGDTELHMVHEGSPDVGLTSTVGFAAGLTVQENETSGPVFRPYRERAFESVPR